MVALDALRRLRRLSSLASLHDRYSRGNQDAAVHCTLKDGSKPHWWSRFRRRGEDSQKASQDPTVTACPAVLYVPEDLEPPRVPMIVPPDSPQCLSDDDEDDSSYATWDFVLPERPSRLSTITEFTESTYDSSSDWHYRVAMVDPRPSSSSETISSHHEVLEYSSYPHQDGGCAVDPDRMATSPYSSAATWVSNYAAAPSHAPAESDLPPKPPNSGATSNNASLRRRSRRRARGERG